MSKHPKVVLAGETNVGKSTYFLQVTDRCIEAAKLARRNPTIACAMSNVVLFPDGGVQGDLCASGDPGEQIVSLWDTAGQERFRSLLPMYYRGADLAIVIHDGTARSVKTAVELIEEIHAGSACTIYMVQNKKDVGNPFDVAVLDRVPGMVAGWAHVGALACDNVKESFCDAVRCMNEAKNKRPSTPTITSLPLTATPPRRRWLWC